MMVKDSKRISLKSSNSFWKHSYYISFIEMIMDEHVHLKSKKLTLTKCYMPSFSLSLSITYMVFSHLWNQCKSNTVLHPICFVTQWKWKCIIDIPTKFMYCVHKCIYIYNCYCYPSVSNFLCSHLFVALSIDPSFSVSCAASNTHTHTHKHIYNWYTRYNQYCSIRVYCKP